MYKGRNPRRLLGLACAVFLSGCAVGPDYQRPALALPDTLPAQVTLSGAERQAWRHWWRQFQDPHLDALVERATDDNLELAVQFGRIRQARAQLGFADAERYPSIGYQLEANRERTPGASIPIDIDPVQDLLTSTNDQFSLAGSLEYELDLWGRLARQREAALATFNESVFARDAAEIGVIADVVTTYFDLKSAEAQQRILEQTETTYQETYRLQKLRFDVGDISELAFRQAEAEWRGVKSELPQVTRQVQTLKGALAILVGMTPRELMATLDYGDTALTEIAEPRRLPGLLPSELLQRRPDVRAAEATLIAANAQVGVAEAARLPSLNLNASIASVAANSSDLFTDNARAWGLGASIVGPLLDFGRTRANVESAQAQVEQAEAQYRLTVLTAFNEVRDALNNYTLSEQRIEAVEAQLAAIERARDLAVLTYDQGQSSMLERLDAERSLLSARLDRAAVQNERLTALATLFKALGGGWEERAVAAR
ncbi:MULTISPECIES: efflux transporter outer membrane subunit [unclassified Halomonas]|uniref:efflux transporter outer membrane subunit n=1 Tax=unclassified Halomonas TaxID=2609666 RepID=UPI0020A07570|nr:MULTISPECIES: efflux transporter outer membrane subunit [unclassified Halomonas]MCP1315348.1 efflux transporter outer membrane subunit [Halomonas sp. 707D7]MCP1328259.1 efflux transporter outer membrane subunit [Halomonas sp. 707D4]